MATGLTLETTFPISWSTAQSEQHFSTQGRKPHIRFKVIRSEGLTEVDLTDHLTYAEVSLGKLTRFGHTAGVDQAIREATFKIAHDRQMIPAWEDDVAGDSEDVVGDTEDVIGQDTDSAALLFNLLFDTDHQWAGTGSFHPKDRRSDWNLINGVYTPLIWSRRECILDVAFSEIGEEPSEFDYVRLIEGVIGDSIRNIGSGSVEFDVRDKAKYLTGFYIHTVREYGSAAGTPVEDVVAKILRDNDFDQIANDFWVPISPGFMVFPFEVDYQSVWDAIQNAIKPTGWFLGFRYRASVGKMVLTLLEPPRGKTAASANWALTADDEIIVQELDIQDIDIRNAAKLTFRDSATGERVTIQGFDPTGPGFRAELRDQDSIDEFGLNVIPLEEDDLSLIDTEAEAVAFGARIISDLSGLRGTTRIESRMLPSMDLFDGATVDDDRLSSTVDFYGAESVRHVLDMQGDEHKYRTEFIGSGKVIGGHSRWLELESREGVKGPLRPEDSIGGGRLMPKPTATARATIRGVAIDVPVPPVSFNRWAETVIHLSTVDGFTPSASTLVDGGRKTHFEMTDDSSAALVPGTTYHLRAGYKDVKGNVGAYSDQVSAVAGQADTPDIVDGSSIGFIIAAGSENLSSSLNADNTYGHKLTLAQAQPRDKLVVIVNALPDFVARFGYQDSGGTDSNRGPFFADTTSNLYFEKTGTHGTSGYPTYTVKSVATLTNFPTMTMMVIPRFLLHDGDPVSEILLWVELAYIGVDRTSGVAGYYYVGLGSESGVEALNYAVIVTK